MVYESMLILKRMAFTHTKWKEMKLMTEKENTECSKHSQTSLVWDGPFVGATSETSLIAWIALAC